MPWLGMMPPRNGYIPMEGMAAMIFGLPPSTRTLLRRNVLLGLMSLTSTGCVLRRRLAERKVKQLGSVDPAQHREMSLSANAPYVIEPPDSLEVRIRPDTIGAIPSSVTVQADGVIDLGFAGRIYVAGLQLDQAESVIAQKLSLFAKKQKKTLDEPIEVNIRLDESKSKFFYVLGKGVQQARFAVTGRETVLDAIMQSQVKSNAILEKTYLVRPHSQGMPDQIMAVDWIAIRDRGETMTNYQIFPGDRLVIPGGPDPGLVETLFGSR